MINRLHRHIPGHVNGLLILAVVILFFWLLNTIFTPFISVSLSIIVALLSLGLSVMVISAKNKLMVFFHIIWPLLLFFLFFKRDGDLEATRAFSIALIGSIFVVVFVKFLHEVRSLMLRFVLHAMLLLIIAAYIMFIATSQAFDLAADVSVHRTALLAFEIPFLYLAYLYSNDCTKDKIFSDWRAENTYSFRVMALGIVLFVGTGWL